MIFRLVVKDAAHQAFIGVSLHFSLTAESTKTAEKTEIRKQRTEKTEI